ncbi:hypothetical protein BKA66DRAFT_568731 [Pyrenochaeta sp. MPI-SDFR-AT-0127]|nr:hypothetical protein BKA66DRAFT_568731 [Pyrenochaeta sp. MPI-SDFR-AT-0127]
MIRETVTYPQIYVTPASNSCLMSSISYEHVLACRHIVVTPEPDEACAPNCHHVASGESRFSRSRRTKISKKHFYCDACVESANELLIPHAATATQAETLRADLRLTEAKNRGKETSYRKCYIALQITSVPCESDGEAPREYVPRKKHHPFDTSTPQIGDIMFEDIDPKLAKEILKERERVVALDASQSSGSRYSDNESQSSDEEDESTDTHLTISDTDAEWTCPEGPESLCSPEELSIPAVSASRAHARARARALARPIIDSSSPRCPTITPLSARKRMEFMTEESEDSEVVCITPPQAKRMRTTSATATVARRRARPRNARLWQR